MPFWLAKQRDGQESSWIQRFDPRFWTVDFPRPMMASVVATAADALRVDCEFHHTDALCGLIWESRDRLDHPLTAYDTDRDYSRTTLSFRWKSLGLIPLDQVDAPTLTIEGKNELGEPRVWYVRLWNYASGTGEDAQVTLPFSELAGGWDISAGGDKVEPRFIDRMFISLVPPGYDKATHNLHAQRRDAWLELTEIRCAGDRPMLTIGDVMLPPHGVGMATAYDDVYNLTPQRILRNIRCLGYRGRIIHYVGMSHYYRLGVRQDTGQLMVRNAGYLCTPAINWHQAFFAACAETGYEPIVSLSFELLADVCPPGWGQQAHDGSLALTGWVPPSTLLSPAEPAAVNYLKFVAANFVAMQIAVGLPVLFQIGEPWFWVDKMGRPHIYDSRMQAALPVHSPAISDLHVPLNPSQLAALEAAGAILASATQNIASSVRALSASAEILLLAFTPTIFDPATPEQKRLNMPLGWASPAFDRLQLEDYDWLTEGAEALRNRAYVEVDQRLRYALDDQDYLAGFVLLPEDSDEFWRKIDSGLDEAAARGVRQLYVWAYPQIMRDGYTRLPLMEDMTMQAFDDIAYPLALGRDTAVSPEFSTSVTVTASGHERRSSLWSDALLRFDVGPGIRSERELGTLIRFFRARRGAARGFRIEDPFDFSSNDMTGTPTMLDQFIATGDGLTASFQLVKRYGELGEPQIRPITRPRAGTIRVSLDGILTSAWTYAESGKIVFADAPPEGSTIRAGFLFDVPVRFAEDRLDVSGVNFAAGEAPSVPLVEIR